MLFSNRKHREPPAPQRALRMCCALHVLCCAGELRALLLPESFAKALRNAMAQAAQAAQAACEHEPGTEGAKNGTNCCQMVVVKPKIWIKQGSKLLPMLQKF